MKIKDDGFVLDLQGGVLEDNILIEASDVIVRNGTVRGEIRARAPMYGRVLEEWNKTPYWTEKIREAAPSRPRLFDLTIDGPGDTHQVYFGPGVTGGRVRNCKFVGRSKGPSVYLSMESGEHKFVSCKFNARLGAKREVIAIDGSKYNLIAECVFKRCWHGGIYIYRNSGENGTIRHQTPEWNVIRNNKFDLNKMALVRLGLSTLLPPEVPHGVIIGSRQGSRLNHNSLDDGYPWGSSASNLDHAKYNTVIDNQFRGDWLKRWVLDTDKNNTVKGNSTW